MKNTVQIFRREDFGSVRIVTIDGEPWFVAVDVCHNLGIVDSHRAVNRLLDDEKGMTSIRTRGGEQSMLIVNEFGLYRLAASSRKPYAREFQRWVFHEVLPAIRKTGTYSVYTTSENRTASVYTGEGRTSTPTLAENMPIPPINTSPLTDAQKERIELLSHFADKVASPELRDEIIRQAVKLVLS